MNGIVGKLALSLGFAGNVTGYQGNRIAILASNPKKLSMRFRDLSPMVDSILWNLAVFVVIHEQLTNLLDGSTRSRTVTQDLNKGQHVLKRPDSRNSSLFWPILCLARQLSSRNPLYQNYNGSKKRGKEQGGGAVPAPCTQL
jgi:hypothetical protein